MKDIRKFGMGLFISLSLVGCDSSLLSPSVNYEPPTIDDYGDGHGQLDHGELAKKFISELSGDTDLNWTLMKTKTNEFNFIVGLNPETGENFAIDIGSYDPNSTTAQDYYNRSNVLTGLIFNPAGNVTEYVTEFVGNDPNGFPIYDTVEKTKYYSSNYKHPETGLRFEKTQGSPKDLAKMAAISEHVKLKQISNHLSENFGLSLQRSEEVARLTSHWAKASKKAMTNEEVSQYTEELLGFSLNQGMRAFNLAREGRADSLKNLIKQSADHNNITPEHALKIISKMLK